MWIEQDVYSTSRELNLPIGGICNPNFVTNIDLCNKFLSMINSSRFLDEHLSILIGKAIHNSYQGNEEGLRLWIRHIESSFVDETNINRNQTLKDVYGNFDDDNVTIRTLAWYAKLDSPEDYDKYMNPTNSPVRWFEYKSNKWQET